MLPDTRRFALEHVSVYEHDQPELRELAESALLEGDGVFTFLGSMWEVLEGEGLLGVYLNIRHEARRTHERDPEFGDAWYKRRACSTCGR